jgi:hypothetical protein
MLITKTHIKVGLSDKQLAHHIPVFDASGGMGVSTPERDPLSQQAVTEA